MVRIFAHMPIHSLLNVIDNTLSETPSTWRSKRAYALILGKFVAADDANFGAMCAYMRLGPFREFDIMNAEPKAASA